MWAEICRSLVADYLTECETFDLRLFSSPFSTGLFRAIFTTSKKVFVIQLILHQTMQTADQMKDEVHVNILSEIDLEIVFEKM